MPAPRTPNYQKVIGGFDVAVYQAEGGYYIDFTPTTEALQQLTPLPAGTDKSNGEAYNLAHFLGMQLMSRVREEVFNRLSYNLSKGSDETCLTLHIKDPAMQARQIGDPVPQSPPLATITQICNVMALKFKSLEALREGKAINELMDEAIRDGNDLIQAETEAARRAQPFIAAALACLDAHHATNTISDLDGLQEKLKTAFLKVAEKSPGI